MNSTQAAILYGELWQQTHYGTMRVDDAKAEIERFFMSGWFENHMREPHAPSIEEARANLWHEMRAWINSDRPAYSTLPAFDRLIAAIREDVERTIKARKVEA